MGLMAGYGLQLWPILQDMSQLKDLYRERAGTWTPRYTHVLWQVRGECSPPLPLWRVFCSFSAKTGAV